MKCSGLYGHDETAAELKIAKFANVASLLLAFNDRKSWLQFSQAATLKKAELETKKTVLRLNSAIL